MEVMIVLAILAVGVVRLSKLGDERCGHESDDARSDLASGLVAGLHNPGIDFTINPAAGLPMLHEGPDGLDIEGNMWGFDDETLPMHRYPADQSLFHGIDELDGDGGLGKTINPATGLPMISDSPAGLDISGNPYGSRWDDVYSHDSSFGSDFGSGSHGVSDFNDSFGSASSSQESFGSGSGASGLGSGYE